MPKIYGKLYDDACIAYCEKNEALAKQYFELQKEGGPIFDWHIDKDEFIERYIAEHWDVNNN